MTEWQWSTSHIFNYDGINYDGINYDGINYDGIKYDGINYDGMAMINFSHFQSIMTESIMTEWQWSTSHIFLTNVYYPKITPFPFLHFREFNALAEYQKTVAKSETDPQLFRKWQLDTISASHFCLHMFIIIQRLHSFQSTFSLWQSIITEMAM